MPDPAAEREAADARGADHATRRHEADRLRRRVEAEPGRSAFGVAIRASPSTSTPRIR
jgi:hypothetical protein